MCGEIKGLDIKGFSLFLENKIFSMNQSEDNASISTHQHWAHMPAPVPVTSKKKKKNWLYHDWLRPDETSLIPYSGHMFLNPVGVWFTGKKGERWWGNQLKSVWNGDCMQQFTLPRIITF